jgi:NAD(P)-dependent dehydrogenase (short-subunit alcohol dehydrogenase family)
VKEAVMRLAGKSAIVTGAAKGIGEAIAHAFTSEGCRLMLVDVDSDALANVAAAINSAGGDARYQVVDVSSRPAVAALVSEAAKDFGRLDIMVNNAGVRSVGWSDMLAVNLNGVAYGIRYAAKSMAESGGGSIISTASIGGLMGLGYPIGSGTDAYVAAKHGVVGLTREYAIGYGPSNVRINCVCPGAIDTNMMRGVLTEDVWHSRIVAKTSLKRVGRPEEIASVFVFLASDESSYITGAAIPVDGGLSAGVNDVFFG